MVLCKFYAKGCCSYGDRCRFEHINPNTNQLNKASSGFSFTKTLEKITRQPIANNQFFSFPQLNSGNYNQPLSDHLYYDQKPFPNNNAGFGPKKFSFNQTLQQINNNAQVTNMQQNKFNLPVIQDDHQMENDVDFALTTPSKPQTDLNFSSMEFVNTSVFHSTPFDSSFSFPKNINDSHVPVTKSFFDINQNQKPKNQNIDESKSSIDASNNIKLKSDIYSVTTELSEEDLINFKSDKFICPIPLCPPPYEVCF